MKPNIFFIEEQAKNKVIEISLALKLKEEFVKTI